MAFVVAPRRPGCKPSLLASMPAELFGKFSMNGKGGELHKAEPASTKPGGKANKSAEKVHRSWPKENVSQSGAYMAAVRTLACRRCGFLPTAPKHNEFAHADEGKGQSIKTDVRRGAALCGKRGTDPGCHWYVGTSGKMKKAERRAFERQAAASTRAEIRARGLWPKRLGEWDEKMDRPKPAA